MKTKGIYIGEALKFGWKTMKENIWFFIVFLVIVWAIQYLPKFIADYAIENSVPKIFFGLLFYVVSLVVSLVLIKVSLKFCDNKKVGFNDFLDCFPLFFKYLLATILYTLIVFVGMILLIFPGVIWGIKFGLFPYFIVDKRMGPIEALKASSKTTMGAKWDLLGFYFVCGVINFLGFICLLIGLFATVPTTIIAEAVVYRRLLVQTEEI